MVATTINPLFVKKRSLKETHLNYKGLSNSLENVSDIKILDSPFKTLQIFNVFQDKFAKNLGKEIRTLELQKKTNDLYNLQQSSDLNNLTLGPFGKKFISLMKTKIIHAFKQIFEVDFNNHISMTVSKYQQGDYLLCHDDKCDDRHLAFVLYLSDVKWLTKDGGILSLFSHDAETKQPDKEVAKLLPTFNSIVLFVVNSTTYHQVTEIRSKKERWSINGWFHSDETLRISNLDYLYISGPMVIAESENVNLENKLNQSYLTSKVIKKISKDFKKNGATSLTAFLELNFYNACLEELKSKVKWNQIGPANHRKYYITENVVLDELDKYLPPHLHSLVTLFCSTNFGMYISNISKKTLIKPNGSRNPLNIEIQRWTKSCYTLLADNDVYQGLNILDVILYFTESPTPEDTVGGVMTYINALEEGTTLTPSSNSLVIADYDENTKKFVRYIDGKSYFGDFYTLALSLLVENVSL